MVQNKPFDEGNMFLWLRGWGEMRKNGNYVRYNDEESDGITSKISTTEMRCSVPSL